MFLVSAVPATTLLQLHVHVVPLAHLQMLTLMLWKSQAQRCAWKRSQQSIFCTHQIRRSSNYTKQTALFSSSNSMSF